MGYSYEDWRALEDKLELTILTKEFGEEAATVYMLCKNHVPVHTIGKNHNMEDEDIKVVYAFAKTFLDNYGREAADDTQPLDSREEDDAA